MIVLMLPLDELLEKVTAPVTAPITVGSKLTCSDMDWPGLSVAGNVAPDTANAPPESATELIVREALPDDLKVKVLVDVAFSAMLPKSRLAALIVSSGATPVPVRATVLVLPAQGLVEIVAVPVKTPVTVGLKLTWRARD